MNFKEEVIKKTEMVSTETLNDIIIKAIQDKKGQSIIKLDMRALEDAPTNFFIICEGQSHTQVKAIADNVAFEIKKQTGDLPNHIEGTEASNWVLVDYFTTVVHVFHPEQREFYQLERLWSDAVKTEYIEM